MPDKSPRQTHKEESPDSSNASTDLLDKRWLRFGLLLLAAIAGLKIGASDGLKSLLEFFGYSRMGGENENKVIEYLNIVVIGIPVFIALWYFRTRDIQQHIEATRQQIIESGEQAIEAREQAKQSQEQVQQQIKQSELSTALDNLASNDLVKIEVGTLSLIELSETTKEFDKKIILAFMKRLEHSPSFTTAPNAKLTYGRHILQWLLARGVGTPKQTEVPDHFVYIDFSYQDFNGFDFTPMREIRCGRFCFHQANLSGATLRISLEDVDLTKVNLQEANLQNVSLQNADLRNANLHNANLQYANLLYANLQEANLLYANLQEADLSYANLQKAVLQEVVLKNTILQEADLKNANLQAADLQKAGLQGADLQKADLQNTNLQGADLQNANLQNANLREANLENAYLENANLQEANLENANLENAYLQNANLQNANLQNANLQEANLWKTNFNNADLQNTNFTRAYLKESKLVNVNFTTANITEAYLLGAFVNDQSTLGITGIWRFDNYNRVQVKDRIDGFDDLNNYGFYLIMHNIHKSPDMKQWTDNAIYVFNNANRNVSHPQPNIARPYYNRGYIAFIIKDKEQSERDYNKAKKSDPDNPDFIPYEELRERLDKFKS